MSDKKENEENREVEEKKEEQKTENKKEKDNFENNKNEDNKNKVNKKTENEVFKEKNFFKKLWYSIVKIEKYPDMAAQGLGKAVSYLCKLVALLSIVLSLGMVYQMHEMVREGVDYLQNEFPEFSYKENILNINTEDVLNIQDKDSVIGEVIIDTKTEDVETINKYINKVEDVGSGVIVLKNKVILKNSAIAGTINYEYSQIFGQMGITQFVKQDVINYANSTQIFTLYLSIFLTIFVYSFIMYFLTTLSNVIILSLFGYIATWIARIRMRYVAIFNMSVYAITLSVILNMLYIGINTFISFYMEYFQVMYVSVAAIYLVAAIFILKSEFIKKQQELAKIAEAQEIVRRELEQQKENEQEKEKDKQPKDENKQNENKKPDKENKKEPKKDSNDNNVGEEPEGSNA